MTPALAVRTWTTLRPLEAALPFALLNTPNGHLEIFRIQFDADEPSVSLDCHAARCAAAHEWIEDGARNRFVGMAIASRLPAHRVRIRVLEIVVLPEGAESRL